MTLEGELSFATWATKLAAIIALNYSEFGGDDMKFITFTSDTTLKSRAQRICEEINSTRLSADAFAEILVLTLRAVARACDSLILQRFSDEFLVRPPVLLEGV